mgnify:CR=1 FL=1
MRKQLILFMICALLLGACTLPATNVPPATSPPEALFTQAVETIIAQMTLSVMTPTAVGVDSTPLPTNTPQPAVTATASPMSPAEAAATATATSLPEATATFTSTLAPTLSSSDPRVGLGEPTFRDSMDTAVNWPLYADSHVRFDVQNGQLVMTAFNPDFYNGWMLTWVKPADFYLEITGTHGACAGRDRFGVVFRAPNGNSGYLFGFSCDGRYSLWYWDGNQEIDIVDWQVNSLIQAGEGKSNRMGVRAEGNRLALYANGSLLIEVQDATSASGGIGVFVGAADTANYTARIDELVYWDLK